MPCMRTWFVMVDYRFNTAVLRTPRVRRWAGVGEAEEDHGPCSKISKSRSTRAGPGPCSALGKDPELQKRSGTEKASQHISDIFLAMSDACH